MSSTAWRRLFIVTLLGSVTTGAQLSTECGYASANGQAFLINGRNATKGESPWHVGLYVNLQQVCGSSLIHPRVVVTAAHCLYSDGTYGQLRNPNDVKVSVGNSLREWSQTSSSFVQQRNVSRIVPHPRYRGRGRLFADDIGLLILEAPVTVSAYVLPVCMNGRSGNMLALTTGSVGKVVGWGEFREGHSDPSDVLQSAEMPFIPFDQCAETVPPDFLPFLTQDKFCAGHIQGASVAHGDSGGGLVFQQKGLWFLMGVVSVGVPNKLTYSAFTNVTAYLDWIDNVVESVDNPEQSPAASVDGIDCVAPSGSKGVCTSLSDCPVALEEIRNGGKPNVCLYSTSNPIVCCANAAGNGTGSSSSTPLEKPAANVVGQIAREKCQEYSRYISSEPTTNPEEQCAVYADWLVGDWRAQPREFPHMALLGFGEETNITWQCGGSLISPEYVLTVAHCLDNRKDVVRWVQLGSLHRDSSDSDDRPQRIAVLQRIPHPAYNQSQVYHNIALLRLAKPAEINGHVRPACLHTEPATRAGEVPVATGWGAMKFGEDPVETMKKLGLPVADNDKCNKAYDPPRSNYPQGILAESQICAGGKGRDTCQGDSGGPLQLATRQDNTEPYCMHKIVGLTAFGKGCRTGAPGVYTRVYYYVPWIESVVWPPPPVVGRIAREKCQEYSRFVSSPNNSTAKREDECGLYSISLLGDWEAQDKEFPHMVALGYGEEPKIEWIAGGSLISPDFVLTAASVLRSPAPTVRWVQLGSVSHPGAPPLPAGAQRIAVRERILHPDFKRPGYYNDIALLRLERPARLDGHVRPACLHTQPALTAGEVPIATGWGALESGGGTIDTLKKLSLPVVDQSTCQRLYKPFATNRTLPQGILAESQICAGGKGRDTCQGDSGGPLQLATRQDNTEPYCMHKIVGLTSFGAGCGSGPPGVYTRVYHFVPWIESIVWPTTLPKSDANGAATSKPTPLPVALAKPPSNSNGAATSKPTPLPVALVKPPSNANGGTASKPTSRPVTLAKTPNNSKGTTTTSKPTPLPDTEDSIYFN